MTPVWQSLGDWALRYHIVKCLFPLLRNQRKQTGFLVKASTGIF